MENETLKTLCERRSIRKYRPEQVSREELEAILKAGTFAPTGRNSQSPVMVVVQDPGLIAKLAKLNAEIWGKDVDPFFGAPTDIIVFSDKRVHTYLYNGSLVMGNLMNAAHSVGVGSCWVHRAKEMFETEFGRELMKKWGLDENYEGIGNCVIGYAAGDIPAAKPRKDGYVIFDK